MRDIDDIHLRYVAKRAYKIPCRWMESIVSKECVKFLGEAITDATGVENPLHFFFSGDLRLRNSLCCVAGFHNRSHSLELVRELEIQ